MSGQGSAVLPRLRRRLERRLARVTGPVIGTLSRVEVGEPVAALTFDDGPDPEYTPRLLDLLARHSARATFFVIGQRAAERPDLIEAVSGAGHQVGNHTWDHPSLPGLSPRERTEQLERCQEALGSHGSMLFRPPYTAQSVGSFLTARRSGFEVVAWSVQVEDWCPHPAPVMEDWLVDRMKPGSIVVLHDSLWKPRYSAARDRGPMLEALDAALVRLERFRFVTVSELMAAGRPVRPRWFDRNAGAVPAPTLSAAAGSLS